MSTGARYLLWQLPGWIVAALVVAWAWPHLDLPAWGAPAAWGAWVLKDLLLYPLVRSAYERRAATGAHRLVGEEAVVTTELSPCGQVRVRGETWRARAEGGVTVSCGTRVVVTRADGLTLHVEAPR